MSLVYGSTKNYVAANGLSCCFRQWRATHSHCRFLHGYSISVMLTFEALKLDTRNWVMDFGGLKPIKEFLVATFDHKTLVAKDDPSLELFKEMNIVRGPGGKLIDLVVLENVGCEAFAKYIYEYVVEWLALNNDAVKLVKVEVREHEGNSAYVRAE